MIDLNYLKEPREVTVPATRETFEAQVLVMTKAYKKMEYPYLVIDVHIPLAHIQRVIERGKYRLELVTSSIANGKPTLIIYEEE